MGTLWRDTLGAAALSAGAHTSLHHIPAEEDQVVIGQGFNAIVNIMRGLEAPNPHIYVVSILGGTIYRIRGPIPVTLQGFMVE